MEATNPQINSELNETTRTVAQEKIGLRSSLRVRWTSDMRLVEEALRVLPPSLEWQGVFEILLEPRGPEKATAIVFDREKPVAIVLLRRVSRLSWELATNWIVPGFLFPALPGYAYGALEALKRDVYIGWWRHPGPAPSGPRIYGLKETPTHRMTLTEDLDEYWQQSGNSSFLRQARRRCKEFTFKRNPPQGFEWVIRNWAEKWRSDSNAPFTETEDRVAVARHLESSARYNTFILYDGDKPIAGSTQLMHRESLVAQVNYRLPEFDRHGVGSYLMEEEFRWAARSGFREFDIGGGVAYKQRWAPVMGSKFEFAVAPAWIRGVQRTTARVRSISRAFFEG